MASRSRSPPGRPASIEAEPKILRHELLEELDEGLLEITTGITELAPEALSRVVSLVSRAAAVVKNAARANRLAVARAEQDFALESGASEQGNFEVDEEVRDTFEAEGGPTPRTPTPEVVRSHSPTPHSEGPPTALGSPTSPAGSGGRLDGAER
jgi:hypothetical protein